jgi:hypothetical protein
MPLWKVYHPATDIERVSGVRGRPSACCRRHPPARTLMGVHHCQGATGNGFLSGEVDRGGANEKRS